MCLPPSLGKWKEKNRIKETNGTAYSSIGDTTCDVNIPEFKAKKRLHLGKHWTRSSVKNTIKNYFTNFQRYRELKTLSPFVFLHPNLQGTRPPTLCSCFSDAAIMLAEKCLIHEKTYDNFISKVYFS